mgnify:CR=1 FL=1
MHDDDTAKFRNLTLIYLEHQVEELRSVKEQLDATPRDDGLRRQWVDLVKDFSERASHLAREWEERYSWSGEEDDLGDSKPLARIDLDRGTPR